MIRVVKRDTSQDFRVQAKGEQLGTFRVLLPESQSQNLVLTVLHVPCPRAKAHPVLTVLYVVLTVLPGRDCLIYVTVWS